MREVRKSCKKLLLRLADKVSYNVMLGGSAEYIHLYKDSGRHFGNSKPFTFARKRMLVNQSTLPADRVVKAAARRNLRLREPLGADWLTGRIRMGCWNGKRHPILEPGNKRYYVHRIVVA